MNVLDIMKGRKVALLGAGVTNMPLASFLAERGAQLTVRDRKSEAELGESGAVLRSLGAELILGEGYLEQFDEDVIFRSPGFRPDLPPLTAAVERGAILTSEMEAFLSLHPCPTYAVTGSDGKSTTTTVISLMLRRALGEDRVFLGGNIGEPLLHRFPMMTADSAVAVELSSFQLMTVDAPLEAAVITNITPNHLNWHTGMEEYIEAKKRILHQARMAVLNYDNDTTRQIGLGLSEIPVTWFSKQPLPESVMKPCDRAVYVDRGAMWYRDGRNGVAVHIMNVDEILLPGMHNVENYMAAAGAVWDVVTPEQIRAVATTFGGVRHRLELVRDVDGVRYYNSSIDSSPTRTAAALSALGDRPLILLCGGYDKNIPFAPLAEAVLSRKNVHTMVLTGATMAKIEAAMQTNPLYQGRLAEGFRLLPVADFDDAVHLAAAEAKAGDTVLLSPACASFDAFPNFEVRGEHFKELVHALAAK